MKIGILSAGAIGEQLAGEYGQFATQFEKLFERFGKSVEWVNYDVHLNHFPQSVNACDAYLISGSKHGVYDNFPWMARLAEFIVEIVAAKKRLVGICFGHQIIAHAMGGEVIKVDKGFAVGRHAYKIALPSAISQLAKGNDFAQQAITSFTTNALHGDQVVVLPDSAEIIASSDWCEFAGLYYPEGILTFQAHPEFSNKFIRDLLKVKWSADKTWVDEAIIEQALTTWDEPTDRFFIANLLINFMTEKQLLD